MACLIINHRLITVEDYNSIYKSGFSGFSTGLIETMLWKKGDIRFWQDHYMRLSSSAGLLGLDISTISAKQLSYAIETLTTANEVKTDCIVRLRVFPDNDGKTNFVLETSQPEWLVKKEVIIADVIGIAQDVFLKADILSALKSSRRSAHDLANAQAKASGWYDALLLNTKSNIAEASINNIFWVKEKVIFTPGLKEACVAGIMRQQILSTKLPWKVEEECLDISGLENADEVFLTNAVRGVQPVRLFAGRTYDMHISHELRSWLQL